MSGTEFADLLAASAGRHSHLCPRQVLGVRIGLAGAAALGLNLPRQDKRLLVILETDGCFADGIEVSTGCTIGHRTLRLEDYGKIAATFVDVSTELALRVTPQLDVRKKAWKYARGETRRYFAQLLAYQSMPGEELLSIRPVCMKVPVEQILSHAGSRLHCEQCGEDIINERVTVVNARNLCRACSSGGYYTALEVPAALVDTRHPVLIDPL